MLKEFCHSSEKQKAQGRDDWKNSISSKTDLASRKNSQRRLENDVIIVSNLSIALFEINQITFN